MNAIAEIFKYRSLLWFLSVRDWKEQTRRSFFGFFWTLAYPFVLGAVFSFLFARWFSQPGNSYAPNVLCALVCWQLFSQTLSSGSSLLAKNREIICKVRFPTEILFLSHFLFRILQFLIWLVVLEAFLIHWGYPITICLWQIVPWALLQSMLAMGLLFLLSPVGLVARDVEQGLGLVLMIWFYATPIVYPLSWVAARFSPTMFGLYLLNPMVGIVEGFRGALLGRPGMLHDNHAYMVLLFSQVLFVYAIGYLFYKKAEPYFAQAA